MQRILCLCLCTAALAAAQDAPAANELAALAEKVQTKTDAWNRQAQNLEQTLIRLLPCDPKAAEAIQGVDKASDERLAAIDAYMDAAIRQAGLQAGAAKGIASSVEPMVADLAAEKTQVSGERAAVTAQLQNLTQSAQKRPSFIPAENTLQQITAQETQRSVALDTALSHASPAAAAAQDLSVQLQGREMAWRDVQAAFATERDRWKAYYAARLVRSETECAVTKGASAPAPAGPARGATKGSPTTGGSTKGAAKGKQK